MTLKAVHISGGTNMSENDTKFCSSCGKKIPINSEFCPHCGEKQPVVSDNPAQEKTVVKSFEPSRPISKSNSTKKWISGIAAVVVLIALIFGLSWVVNHSKSPENIASSIQSKLRTKSADYGKAKATWNSDSEVIEISLPKNSHVVESLEDGSPALWNSLVRDLRSSSTAINKKNNPNYSHIAVVSPHDTNYLWLEINHGKIKYNQGDNLN